MLREREMPPDIELRPEEPHDHAAVERLYVAAFGPGRHSRTAALVRGSVPHDLATSFVAVRRGLVIGAIRQAPARIEDAPAFLLGPLAVAETAAKQGIGRALLNRSTAAGEVLGAHATVLIGDPAFYGPSGFARIDGGAIWLDAPVEPHRFLVRLPEGAAMPRGRLVVETWGA